MRIAVVAVAASLGLIAAAAAGCSGESTQKPAVAKPETLLDTRCAECHDLSRVNGVSFDRAGWEKIIDRMIQRGARLNADERQVLVDYLAERD